MNEYISQLTRALITFVTLFTLIRFMGKRHAAEITIFDYTVGIAIGSMAGNLTLNKSTNILSGILAMSLWGIIAISSGILIRKSKHLRKLAYSQPIIIVQNGKIIRDNMIQANYNVKELLTQLRQKGVFNMNHVECAILESTGQLSVLKKSQYSPLTPEEVNHKVSQTEFLTDIIIDGLVITPHLEQLNHDTKWLLNQLKVMNISSAKDVLYAGLTKDGQIYIS